MHRQIHSTYHNSTPALFSHHVKWQPTPIFFPGKSHGRRSLFSLVVQLCLTLCDSTNCSMQSFPVNQQIQSLHKLVSSWWFHPTISSSVIPFSSYIQSFPSLWYFLHFKWLKYWSFSIGFSNEHSWLISFMIEWFDLLAAQGTLKSLHQTHSKQYP